MESRKAITPTSSLSSFSEIAVKQLLHVTILSRFAGLVNYYFKVLIFDMNVLLYKGPIPLSLYEMRRVLKEVRLKKMKTEDLKILILKVTDRQCFRQIELSPHKSFPLFKMEMKKFSMNFILAFL